MFYRGPALKRLENGANGSSLFAAGIGEGAGEIFLFHLLLPSVKDSFING